jgi:endonuclease YncB( thermonuclease family)
MRVRPDVITAVLVVVALAIDGSVTLAAQEMRKRVGKPFNGLVVTVADGDTVEVIPDGEPTPIRIRLEEVDTPELDEPYGRDAMIYTRILLLKKRVHVLGHDVDRYERLVARVTAAGRDISLALLQMGLACHFTQFTSDPELAKAAERARSHGAGFWAPQAPKPRCTGIAAKSQTGTPVQGPVTFRGNVNSRLYHASTCANANCPNCTRVFSSEADAKAAGFTPAGDCLRKTRN